MIRVTVNGEEQEFPDEMSVSKYVSSLGVDPKMIAIAYNGEVLRRDEWAEVTLSDGDTLRRPRGRRGVEGALEAVHGSTSSPRTVVGASGITHAALRPAQPAMKMYAERRRATTRVAPTTGLPGVYFCSNRSCRLSSTPSVMKMRLAATSSRGRWPGHGFPPTRE